MNNTVPVSRGQVPVVQQSANTPVTTPATNLVQQLRALGLSIYLDGPDLQNLTLKGKSLLEMLNNPALLSILTQDFYWCDNTGTTWAKLHVRNGRVDKCSVQISMKCNRAQMVNRTSHGFDYLLISYSAGAGNVQANNICMPQADFTPERIQKHFPDLIGESANDPKESGKVLFYIISRFLREQTNIPGIYIGDIQGFSENVAGQIQFNPPPSLCDELKPYCSKSLLCRQYPKVKMARSLTQHRSLSPCFRNR